MAGGSVSRLRCRASASCGLLAVPVHAVDGPPGVAGHLAGDREVLLADAAAGVEVDGEDADGPALRGQRQHQRRGEAQLDEQVAGLARAA